MNFTYQSYRELVHTILLNGYEITDYHLYKGVKNPCILRHDIDMDLCKAAEFAEIEREILGEDKGLNATYFVLISSDFYNPFSKEGIACLKRITGSDHEIGLHFDEKKYMGDEDVFNPEMCRIQVKKEISLLSEIINSQVRVVSMHRPSKQFLESRMDFGDVVNSYSAPFFDQFKYLSDSRMCWRENIEEVVKSKQEQALHVLTHPFWYSFTERTLRQCLYDFISRGNGVRYNIMKENFRDLEAVLNLEEIK